MVDVKFNKLEEAVMLASGLFHLADETAQMGDETAKQQAALLRAQAEKKQVPKVIKIIEGIETKTP